MAIYQTNSILDLKSLVRIDTESHLVFKNVAHSLNSTPILLDPSVTRLHRQDNVLLAVSGQARVAKNAFRGIVTAKISILEVFNATATRSKTGR